MNSVKETFSKKTALLTDFTQGGVNKKPAKLSTFQGYGGGGGHF